MKSIVIAVAMAAMFATSDRALAAEAPMMTVDFVGEWCLDHLDGIDQDKNVTWYKSPSWTEGQCKGILSITKYGFRNQSMNCGPLKIKLKEDRAPSGTSYHAMITARCFTGKNVVASQFQGPRQLPSEVRTFEFMRYKGTLKLTEKN